MSTPFEFQELCGWAGMEEAQRAWVDVFGAQESGRATWNFVVLADHLPPGSEPAKRVALWAPVRQILGRDTPNYPQQVGDCVAFGAKNVEEYLQCQEIAAGDREEFHPVYPPYNYGTSRVQVGGGRLRGDGSTGAWMAAAAMRYGVLRADFPGVPPYSGQVSREWGRPPGPPEPFLQEGKMHIVRSAAPIGSVEEAALALSNGYPLTIASNQGFTMTAGRDGFHAPSGMWAHQMAIVYWAKEPEPHFGILNSWGDQHGRLRDFITDEEWPIGMLRVRAEVVGRMISSGECFAYSQFDGFPARRPDYALF